MKKEFLTRAECNALRGVAIAGIVLHNFCHWLPGIIRENEYLFHANNVIGLSGVMSSPDWNLTLHLLSFFGHYGVPMFLFLSAYGLVMKYENGPEPNDYKLNATHASWWDKLKFQIKNSSALQFLWRHFVKLFRMMVIGFGLFVLVDAMTPGRHRYELLDVVAQLGLFNNLLEFPDGVAGHRHSVIWPGPYWFFGLMMQLYIVYRLFLYRRHWGWTVGLMVVCTLVQMFCGPESTELYRLRYNFIGGMLPFGYGLLVARMPMPMSRGYNWLFGLMSLYFIYSLSFSYISWFFVPLFVCSAGFCLVKVTPDWLLRILTWLGGISAALFVLHPITRKVLIPISRHDGLYTGLALYIVASLVLAWVMSDLISGKKK
ncbi:MAG: acyltransferase family protein [Prevotella sp.]|nr:acyltransferase family protein [Prevotella sp.]